MLTIKTYNIMVSLFTTELIKGVIKKVQLVTYSNGTKKKRVFANMHDVVPEEVITLSKKP